MGTRCLILILSVCLSGCNLVGGAGSIKVYEFPVSKKILQTAVEKVLSQLGNVYRDTTYTYMIDATKDKKDTIKDNYYNDGIRYTTIYIVERDLQNEYTFQFSGDSAFWDSSKISYISIVYAYDKERNGGSAGYGEVTGYKPLLKKQLTSVFENEFIERIDKQLHQKHRVID